MKTVLLVRHGKSDWSTDEEDRERPLAKRGRRAARAIAEFLASSGQEPDAIVSSPARRALDTAELLVETGGWSCAVRTNEQLYGADDLTTLAVARAEPDTVERLMLVGHEPATSEALACFVGGGNFKVPTAAVACIELELERWSDLRPSCGRLAYLVVPRLLDQGPPGT